MIEELDGAPEMFEENSVWFSDEPSSPVEDLEFEYDFGPVL